MSITKWTIPLLAVLGFADSAYLAVTHWRGELPPCGGYVGCDLVNTSKYAEVFGVPIAALGALLYATILAVSLINGRPPDRVWVFRILTLYGLSLAGAIFMSYLTAVELFVIHAICYWCVALALITFLVLILATSDVWRFEPESISPNFAGAHPKLEAKPRKK